MTFGGQTVTLVVITDGVEDRNGIPTPVEAFVTVSGCRFRPLKPDEKEGLLSTAKEPWKLTAPPSPEVVAAKSVDRLLYDGTGNPADTEANTFQVIGGAGAFNDMGSAVFKVTVFCERQSA